MWSDLDAVFLEWLDERPEFDRFAEAMWELLAQLFAPVTAVAVALIECRERRL